MQETKYLEINQQSSKKCAKEEITKKLEHTSHKINYVEICEIQ